VRGCRPFKVADIVAGSMSDGVVLHMCRKMYGMSESLEFSAEIISSIDGV
jgi:hypothetical protein